MKNKLFIKVLACALTLLTLTSAFTAFADADNDVENAVNAILDQKMKEQGVHTTQELIDGYFSSYAGILSEWYVIALARRGEYDFSAYETALNKYVTQNKVIAASTKQKLALALLSFGSRSDYVESILDQTIGEQGIMSYVFGLHLLSNGQTCKKFSKEAVILELLELEIDGGGWALTGQNADIDVTAMVISALAPYYDEYASVKEKVDKALDVLSKKQLENGDFLSYGVANPESSAQVIIALSTLGIDFATDERFIKNGNTLFDVIKKYQLENGAFCHQIGKGANENATSQVFLALCAYQSFKNGQDPIFIFNQKSSDQPITPSTTTEHEEVTTQTPSTSTKVPSDTDRSEPIGEKKISYKIVACAIIAALCIALCALLFVTKKANPKNLIALFALGALLISLFMILDIQSPNDYYSDDTPPKSDPVGVVRMSIRCDAIADKVENSVILDETEFVIEAGDTVYTVLIEAAKKYGILIENNGNDKMAYIVGINNIYEMDHGDLSGWIYTVNGKSVSVGCSECELRDGDTVIWEYTLDLGNLAQN